MTVVSSIMDQWGILLSLCEWMYLCAIKKKTLSQSGYYFINTFFFTSNELVKVCKGVILFFVFI